MSFERSLMERLHACNHDERRIVERVLERLLDGIELGRRQYGAAHLSRDRRNWRYEGANELRDWLFYCAANEIADEYEERARTDTIAAQPEPVTPEISVALSTPTADLLLCGHCGHPYSLHHEEHSYCLLSSCKCGGIR